MMVTIFVSMAVGILIFMIGFAVGDGCMPRYGNPYRRPKKVDSPYDDCKDGVLEWLYKSPMERDISVTIKRTALTEHDDSRAFFVELDGVHNGIPTHAEQTVFTDKVEDENSYICGMLESLYQKMTKLP